MNRTSDEMLERLATVHPEGGCTACSIASELLAYRKAVKEYLEAVDVCNKLKGHSGTTPFAEYDALYARQVAEATLRALEEKL